MTWKCQRCGKVNKGNSDYCKQCGCHLGDNQPINYYQQPPVIINQKKNIGCFTKVLIAIGAFVVISFIFAILFSTDNSKKFEYESNGITEANQATIKTEIKESLIYDENKVKIFVKGIDDNVIKIYIENNSNKSYHFDGHSCAVNGIMATNSSFAISSFNIDANVAANSKANTELKIEKSFLREYSITDIQTVDINIWAYDNAKSFKSFDTGRIRIKTNKYSDGNARIKSKKNLFNKNSVSIDYIGQDGKDYIFSLTNSQKELLTFEVKDITINGYTINDWLTQVALYDVEVLDGCQCIFKIEADDDFLEENEINDVKSIRFNTVIEDNNDNDIYRINQWETGNISVSVD